MFYFFLLSFLFVSVDIAHSTNHCPDKTCDANANIVNENEERIVMPWKLKDFEDYTISDANTAALMNKQINLELQAFYVYLSMAYYFDRDDISMPGFHKFFKAAAEEEYSHATVLMQYMNKRGTAIHFSNISVPCANELLDAANDVSHNANDGSRRKECHSIQSKITKTPSTTDTTQFGCEWGDPLSATSAARQLEINVYRHLKRVHRQADKTRDVSLQDLLETYLDEQVESIKQLSELVTQLKRVEPCLGHHLIDKELADKTKK